MHLRRPLSILATLMLMTSLGDASVATAQNRAVAFDGSVGAETRWGFRVVTPVILTSPIVRLGDVVQPVDPHQAGWQRLSRAAIGLIPISGETMTIRRDRLGKAILAAEATPRLIDWYGGQRGSHQLSQTIRRGTRQSSRHGSPRQLRPISSVEHNR